MAIISSTGSPNIYYKRLMVFVDGTNFLVELSKKIRIPFRADKPPWKSINLANDLISTITGGSEYIKIRRYWFGSYQGNDVLYKQYCTVLRDNDFEPIIFSKPKGKEKGVDIALTKEMLVNAFHQNYDVGFLISGDEDYLSVVNEIKRYGPTVKGSFFSNGLSDELRLSFDSFKPLELAINNERLKLLSDEILKELNSSKKEVT